MSDHSEAFVAFDTSKLRNAVAIAGGGRGDEVRFLGEFDNTPAATAKLVRKLAAKYERLTYFHSWRSCSPTAPIKGGFLQRRSTKSCLASKPKSSNVPIMPRGSYSYPGVGSSSAPSRGSTVAAVSPRIGKISTATPLRS